MSGTDITDTYDGVVSKYPRMSLKVVDLVHELRDI